MGKKCDGLTAKERKAEAAAIKRAQKAEKKDEEKAKQDAIAQLRREIAVIPPELKVPTASPADRDEEEVPPSQIGRKRKMKPLSLGERRKYPIGHELATPEPTTISPELRMQQYPNHGLRSYEDGNNRPCLFCDMCNCPVSLIKQRIEIHLQTNKHLEGIKREERLRARQLQFDESITSTDRAYGDTLLKSITDARLSVLYALMQAAVPREKLYVFGELRRILEVGASCSLPRAALDALIPRVAKVEDLKLKNELGNARFASIIFDGASEVTEVFSIIVRFWDGCVKQRLVSLSWLAKSMNAIQQSTHLINQLSRRIVDPAKLVCATIHDGAAVNGACVDEIHRHSPHIIDITCVSHTVCLCEKGFNCPTAEVFLSEWGTMIAQSWRAREEFRELTGQQALRPARVKWFATQEVVEQLFRYWPAMTEVVTSNHGCYSPTLREKMRVILHDHEWILKLELALLFDVGGPLLRLCYLDEGDDMLAARVYGDILRATACLQALWTKIPEVMEMHFPNLCSVAYDYVIAHPGYTIRQVVTDNLAKAKRVGKTFGDNFFIKYKATTDLWKFCRLFNPHYVKDLDIDQLCAEYDVFINMIPAPLRGHRQGLRKELAMYHAGAIVYLGESIQAFWVTVEHVPTWKTCAEFIALLQPSSGAAERAFSTLRWSFDAQQESTLSDYKETAVCIRFNDTARDTETRLVEGARALAARARAARRALANGGM